MQLNLRDVSRLLKVSEQTVCRWIEHGMIPAHKVCEQYRFNRAELLEWATARNMALSPEIFQEPDSDENHLPTLHEALKSGGVYYGIKGSDKPSILRSMVEKFTVLKEGDREFVLSGLLAREALASTGVGGGIAIPHVRNPIILNVQASMIALGFLETPVDFEAFDGKPVQCLFTLISPTVRIHLHLLSKLAFALRDSQFKKLLLRQAQSEEVLKKIQKIEEASRSSAKEKAKAQ